MFWTLYIAMFIKLQKFVHVTVCFCLENHHLSLDNYRIVPSEYQQSPFRHVLPIGGHLGITSRQLSVANKTRPLCGVRHNAKWSRHLIKPEHLYSPTLVGHPVHLRYILLFEEIGWYLLYDDVLPPCHTFKIINTLYNAFCCHVMLLCIRL